MKSMSNKEFKGDNAAEIVKAILDEEKISRSELAERMGCVRQNVSQALSRGKVNMRYDSFDKMVSALGYEIVVRKK